MKLYITPMISLVCDTCGKHAPTATGTVQVEVIALAVNLAKMEGWKCYLAGETEQFDCPECQKRKEAAECPESYE